jgi:hypothetical protein
MKVKNKDPKKGPPFEPEKDIPAKPDPNPDPTRIEEPKKNDPTRIDEPPIKQPIVPPVKTPDKPNTPSEPKKQYKKIPFLIGKGTDSFSDSFFTSLRSTKR